MSKDARNEDLPLSLEVREKFDELVALLSEHRYGPDGPPRETTFAQIEQFGHQTGRMLARAVDAQLTGRHSEQFEEDQQCPACQARAEEEVRRKKRRVQTADGDVPLAEPVFHCPVCDRDFFPSA